MAAVVVGLGLTACTSSDGAAPASSPAFPTTTPSSPTTSPPPTSPPTASPTPDVGPVEHPTLWLCRPGMADNPCEGGLDATVVAADGSRSREPFVPAVDPPADCFYVYPTVSQARTRNAPLRATEAETDVARIQAARFAASCRLYAPVYRQITRKGLVEGGFSDAAARDLAYADVRSAFADYLARFNRGRPFVLLGHSQGATVLVRLVQEEIDGDAALRAQLQSALLLGGGVWVPPGRDVGGSFRQVPACGSATQTGCVVAYATYEGRPPADGLFGRSSATQRALCVDPSRLLGRGGRLLPYLPTTTLVGAEPLTTPAPTTGFTAYPAAATARCASTPGFSWLDVRFLSGPGAMPTLPQGNGADWGLHRVDVTIALGDLVDLVARQSGQR